MKTSLGIWAFGNMATRFNPGGYKPELAGQTTTDRIQTAVAPTMLSSSNVPQPEFAC